MEQSNFDNKQVQKSLAEKKNFSIGKNYSCESLLLSKFTLLFISLPKLSSHWIQQFDKYYIS